MDTTWNDSVTEKYGESCAAASDGDECDIPQLDGTCDNMVSGENLKSFIGSTSLVNRWETLAQR